LARASGRAPLTPCRTVARGARCGTALLVPEVSVQDIKLGTVPDNAAQDATARSLPWREGSATGVGSMPDTDPARACAVIMDELPDFPFLPELPARGVGADMIGRAASLLIDLPVETTPRGWKFAAHPGRDQRAAASFLSFDLDAAQEAAEGYSGPYKVTVCGPLTLAARIELSRSMNPALADPGALADLTNSLAEGVAAHVQEIRQRIPGATVVVQLDEPDLPAVLAGRVPTASGLGMLAALDQIVASATLRSVLEAATAFTVSSSSTTSFAAQFSSKWATLDVPGIGNMTGERFNSHASDNCPTVTSFFVANVSSGPPRRARLPAATGYHGMKPMPSCSQ